MFAPFLMGISKVGPTPRRPSSSSTAAVADVVPQNGLSLVAGSWRQFDTESARWRPEPRLHGSASVCTVLMDISEVVSAPPAPSSSGTAVAAHSVLKSGSNRLSAGEVRQFWRVLVETAPSEQFHWLRLGAKPRFDP